MPQPVELVNRNGVLADIDAAEMGFSYACRRCDVWGRIPAGAARRCWLCERADRLEHR